MSDIIGQRTDETTLLKSKLNSIHTQISYNLNELENIMSNINGCFECGVCDSIKDKFTDFSTSFPIINANLENYSEDFINLNQSFSDHQKSIKIGEVEKVKEGGDIVNVKI